MAARSATATSTGLASDMEAVHNSIMGHLELSPKFVRMFADIECQDKHTNETYKAYCMRLQGSSFDYDEWKKLCSFSHTKFETVTNPNGMDVTALGHLFRTLFKIKNDQRNSSAFRKKLQKLAGLRNSVMHNVAVALNPDSLDNLVRALKVFIQVGGTFYSLSVSEIQKLQDELETDIQAGFSKGTKQLLYAKASMITEGSITMENFLKCNFETMDLMFSTTKVERSAVFHELEVVKNKKTFPYSEIFKHLETFIIVSGVAGAGKSTLLENIALEFVEPQPDTSARLLHFDLLVYIQCRDHTTKTLSDVMIQQFPDVRTKLGEKTVLEALFTLQVLFLMDGYDEYNHSMKVLQEMIKKTQLRANCQVIITTRPHAVKRLKQLLLRDSVNFSEFEIAPLSELKQQLRFLRKYEPHLPGLLTSGAIRENFESLPDPIRRAFTEPLRLLQFCGVFITDRDKISKWKRMNDIAEDVFIIYKTLVSQKITNTSYADIDCAINTCFLVISEAALHCLRTNTLTLTKDQFDQVKRKCSARLQAEHDLNDVDTKIVLSCIFKVKRSLAGKGDPTYSFNHKTDQEYFASKCVLEKLCTTDASVNDVLMGKELRTVLSILEVLEYVVHDLSGSNRQELHGRWPELKEVLLEEGGDFSTWKDLVMEYAGDSQMVKSTVVAEQGHNKKSGKTARILDYRQKQREKRFLEVVEYVIKDLSSSGPSVLDQRWLQLKEALVEEGADLNTWKDLVLSCASNLEVVNGAAQAARDQNAEWNVESGRDTEAMVLMLPHAQPHLLNVKMSTAALRNAEWTKVLDHLKEDVQLSLQLSSADASDDMLETLHGSKCRLHFFEGAVTTDTGVTALASVASEKTLLNIWLLNPLTLAALQGKYCHLTVNKNGLFASDEGDSRTPLPAQPPPELVMFYVPQRAWKSLVHTVQTLAPDGNRYGGLTLRYGEQTVMRSNEDLDRTVVALHRQGIRTAEEGFTRWERMEGDHKLHITDRLPTGLEGLRNLLDLRDHIVGLSTSMPEQLQAQWPEMRDKFQAAGARCWDWQDLMLCCPGLENVAQIAAKATLLEEQEWKVRTGEDLAAVALMLPYAQPSTLEVTLAAAVQDVGRWEKVALLRDGDLRLELAAGYEVACDDLLAPLHRSSCRCRLVNFSGLIISSAGLAAVASVAEPTANLRIWLQSKMDLSILQNKCKRLVVHTRTLIADGGSALLPSRPPPVLEVEHASCTGWADVVHTVKAFAPANKTYGGLMLGSESISYGDVDRAVVDLQREGIRTEGSEPTGWKRRMRKEGRTFQLHITDELPSHLAHL